jgi:predicted transcriptional regulator
MSAISGERGDAEEVAPLRRSILELAPLELDCMNALWSVGEGTVRQIQQIMLATRPRAYTTIMTILDRLTQKGVVAREKKGRAYLYRPNLTAEQARAHAIERIVDGFFDGSSQALAAQLADAQITPRSAAPQRVVLPAAAQVQRKTIAAVAAPVETKPTAATEPSLDAALL